VPSPVTIAVTEFFSFPSSPRDLGGNMTTEVSITLSGPEDPEDSSDAGKDMGPSTMAIHRMIDFEDPTVGCVSNPSVFDMP
jgi:hypothetical protein